MGAHVKYIGALFILKNEKSVQKKKPSIIVLTTNIFLRANGGGPNFSKTL